MVLWLSTAQPRLQKTLHTHTQYHNQKCVLHLFLQVYYVQPCKTSGCCVHKLQLCFAASPVRSVKDTESGFWAWLQWWSTCSALKGLIHWMNHTNDRDGIVSIFIYFLLEIQLRYNCYNEKGAMVAMVITRDWFYSFMNAQSCWFSHSVASWTLSINDFYWTTAHCMQSHSKLIAAEFATVKGALCIIAKGVIWSMTNVEWVHNY